MFALALPLARLGRKDTAQLMDPRQTSSLITSEFKHINQLLFP